MASTVVNLRKPVSGRLRLGFAPEAPKPRHIEIPKSGGLLRVWIHERVNKASRHSKARVPLAELPVFTRQLGRMVAAGLTLDSALNALAGQTRNKAMAAVIQDVRRRIEAGASFSAAIAACPKVFSRLYVAMVTSGERAGLLPEVLDRLARTLESTVRLRRKVKSAVIYPIFVIIVALLVASFLLMSVLPVFGEVFRTFGATLPAPTRCLIEFGNLAKHWLPVTLLAMGAATYLWLYFIATPFGRFVWDSWRIRLPILGDIAHKLCLARFARTFGCLVRSGVPILETLDIASKTTSNVLLEKAIKRAAADIEQGETVSDALSKFPVFSDMIVSMVAAGEQTGELDTMLENVADFLDEETEIAIGGLTVLIEPMLIVFLGVVLGGMVVCMFLPIFKLPEIVNSGR
jgi:type IV pilus assembly protein PilC